MRKTVVLCDLDDGDNPRPGVAVIEMAIDGVLRPLDVCGEHLRLLKSLSATSEKPAAKREPARQTGRATRGGSSSRNKAAARPVPKKAAAAKAAASSPGARSQRKPTSRRSRQARIALAREWARSQGRDVADKGRLPAGLLDEFEKAHR